ncbi:MAG: hypothetical protein Q7J07_07395 [Pelolinea sp.]|nr:hypothetical protein [Pelolinea sp.]
MDILGRIFRRIQREINLRLNRFQVWRVNRSITGELSSDDTRPVIIFNASTRLSGLSQNAGFSLITSLALRKNQIPTHHVFCDHGLRPCVLGTDRNDPERIPPCRECTRTSRLILKDANSHSFTYKEDVEISKATKDLGLDQLLSFTYQGIPLGELVLPSMRWILRKHHLKDNKNNKLLAQNYIRSAWGVFGDFSDLIDKIQPQAVLVFNGMF